MHGTHLCSLGARRAHRLPFAWLDDATRPGHDITDVSYGVFDPSALDAVVLFYHEESIRLYLSPILINSQSFFRELFEVRVPSGNTR